MEMEVSKAKNELRQKTRAVLKRISPAVRAAESFDLCARLKLQLPGARTILFFAPLANEIDLWPLLEELLAAGKTVALPWFDSAAQTYLARRVVNLTDEIVAGKFGVREPAPSCAEIPLEQFDLILVPGMAFDLTGNRLGRGKGFYDRLLAKTSGVKCGVCHDFQLLETIPAEATDAKVDFIFTPSRCVRRKR
jgi:5-formyltetrahydrofolate cyclo-ligase